MTMTELSHPLATAYAAARGEVPSADVEELLGAGLEAARREHPGVTLSADAFARHVASIVSPDRLGVARLSDLFLVAACLEGEPAAIAAFERVAQPILRGAVGRIAREGASTDELVQALRVKLLVGEPGKKAALAQYEGRGALEGWVRILVTRFALNERRTSLRRREDSDEALGLTASADADPELRHLRARHAGPFKAAFETAVTELTPDARNVLRFHYLDRLNIDQIGLASGVHRVTAYRHLEKAKRDLIDRTRAHLRAELGVDEAELESVMRALDGEIELSLSRLFGPGCDP